MPGTFQAPIFVSPVRLPVTSGAGVQTPLTLTAGNVVLTASIQNSVGKPLTATTIALTASMVRSVGKILTATTIALTATVVKSVGKTLTATTVTLTASLTALKVKTLALTATTITTTATMVRSTGKPLTATTVALTATIVRSVGKVLSATITITATLSALKVKLLTMTATVVATSASIVKSVGKPLTATTVALTASIVKSVGKALTATTITVTASLVTIKAKILAMTATVTTSAAMVRSAGKILSATVTSSPIPPFATPILSTFTGGDENPISEGGNWAKLDTSNATNLTRVSNQAKSSGGLTGESYWTPTNFGPDVDVFVTIATLPGDGNNVDISGRIAQAGGSATYDGYRARAFQVAGTDRLSLNSVTNGGITEIATADVPTGWAAGDKIGLRINGSTIQGWRYDGVSWARLVEVVDATYAAAGAVALHIRGGTGAADDFGAGTTNGIVKQIAKRLTVTVTTSASLAAIRVFVKALTATVTTSATMVRRTGKALTATLTTSATVAKQIAKKLTATTVTLVATLITDVFVAGAVRVFGYFSNRPRQQDFDTPMPGGEFDPPDAAGEVDE